MRAIVLGSVFLAAGCNDMETVRVTARWRDPMRACEEALRVFEFEVEIPEVGELVEPPEWCGVLEGHMMCFLNNRGTSNKYSGEALRELSHSKVEKGNPELVCWQVELEKWDADAKEGATHPVWGRLPESL